RVELLVALARAGGLARVLDLRLLVPQHRRSFPLDGARDGPHHHLFFQIRTLAHPHLLLVERHVDRVLLERAVAARRRVAAAGHVLDDDLLARDGHREVLLLAVDRLVNAHAAGFAGDLLYADLLAHERNPDLVSLIRRFLGPSRRGGGGRQTCRSGGRRRG